MKLFRNAFSVEAPAGGPVRRLLLVGVLVLCGVAFWYHFERRFSAIEARVALMDEGGRLSDAERESVLGWREKFRQAFGIKVLVHVRTAQVHIPDLTGETLFLGLVPGSRQGTVVLPPLVRRALPQGFKTRLEYRLDECADTPGPCVEEALGQLFSALQEGVLEPEQAAGGQPSSHSKVDTDFSTSTTK